MYKGDFISTAIYRKNGEEKRIYFLYDNGKVRVAALRDGHDSLSNKAKKEICNDFMLGHKPDLTPYDIEGEKLCDIDVFQLLPTENEESIRFNIVLEKVMRVMQDAYPTCNAEFIKMRLPYLKYKTLREDEANDSYGVYEVNENSIYLDDEILSCYHGFQTLLHESLHLASSKENSDPKCGYGDCGFHNGYDFGIGINEGITEAITEDLSGKTGTYTIEKRFARMLFAIGNKEEIIDRYFKGDISIFKEIFGEEKAMDFISNVDLLSTLDGVISDTVNDSLAELEEKLIDEEMKKSPNFDLTEEEFDIIEEASREVLRSTYKFKYIDATFMPRAEQDLLDVYERKLEKLSGEKDKEEKLELVKEFKKNFYTYDEIKDCNDLFEDDVCSELVDMDEMKKVTERFKNINDKFVSKEELKEVMKRIDDEEQDEGNIVMDEEFEDFLIE